MKAACFFVVRFLEWMQPTEASPWSEWNTYFERNAGEPLPAPVSAPNFPDEQRRVLARSLAIFQLGEAGEGRIAREVWNFEHPLVDDHWRRSLQFWVREEGRHARILGGAVGALGGRPIAKNWTNKLLIIGRRLLGIRLKLLVVLSAEVIGIVFYGAIADALPKGSLRDSLLQIAKEESAHLSFQTRFFGTQTRSPLGRACFVPAWLLVGSAAGLTVLVDHRPALRALGIRQSRLMLQFGAELLSVAKRVRQIGLALPPSGQTALARSDFSPGKEQAQI